MRKFIFLAAQTELIFGSQIPPKGEEFNFRSTNGNSSTTLCTWNPINGSMCTFGSICAWLIFAHRGERQHHFKYCLSFIILLSLVNKKVQMHAMASLEKWGALWSVYQKETWFSGSVYSPWHLQNIPSSWAKKKKKSMLKSQKYIRKVGCQKSLFDKQLRRRVCLYQQQ